MYSDMFIMHATQTSSKTLIMTNQAFVKLCKELKVYPVSRLFLLSSQVVVTEESLLKVVDFCCMKRQQRDEIDQAKVFEFPDFIRAFKVRLPRFNLTCRFCRR